MSMLAITILRRRAMRAAITLAVVAPAAVYAVPPQTNATRGRDTFVRVGCYACHGTRGSGGGAGPAIAPNPPPIEALFAQLRHPIRDMPAYPPSLLSDADIRDIYAFLQSVKPGKKVDQIPALNH
jgi:mono/diheme cytochrome c family protein